ncbi:hypothetical protein [Nocardioides panaciterrulae]|uniref:Uncharacterized protein n=1 Tax=Nocardioides panaciterrulae TaxID=661492 RepID=A0A7Y9E6Q7_9ACTN|nr:hypothetical protein [Nocardioides panaciterrulae]NYD42221.1 hypothetical protein [Nocardioides panaciterrulae]
MTWAQFINRVAEPRHFPGRLELLAESWRDILAVRGAEATDNGSHLNPAVVELDAGCHSKQPHCGLPADLARPDT